MFEAAVSRIEKRVDFVRHCVRSLKIRCLTEFPHAQGGELPAACAGAVTDTLSDTPPGCDWLF